jgi:predicted transcriptional regulator
MTTDTDTKSVLERVTSWPPEDVAELAECARDIEARRTGIYEMNDEERAAVLEGLAQANRGEFASDEEVEAFWKRCGVK